MNYSFQILKFIFTFLQGQDKRNFALTTFNITWCVLNLIYTSFLWNTWYSDHELKIKTYYLNKYKQWWKLSSRHTIETSKECPSTVGFCDTIISSVLEKKGFTKSGNIISRIKMSVGISSIERPKGFSKIIKVLMKRLGEYC